MLPLFKSARVAYLNEPASRFSFAALTLRILVASVSGNNTTLNSERTATVSAILSPPTVSISPTPNPRDQEPTHQNVHLHPTGLTNPATIGAATGPTTVAPDHNIMTLPLGPSSQNTSAITPPTTLTGGLPNVPVKNLHAKKTPQLGGASAVPSSDSVNSTKLTSSVGRRPWLSLSGAKMSGPNMKPMR